MVFALLMIVAGLWLGSISLGEQGRMMKDFGLVAVTVFGLIVAVFVAAGLVHKEVEKRTVFVLFSKPVSRSAFIAGKFVGLCGTMAVVLAGMGLFLFALVWIVAGQASGMVLLAMRHDLRAAPAVMAVTIFFSTLGSAILATVLGICVFVAGQLSHNVLSLTRLGKNPVTEALSWVVYVIVPNFSAVDVKAGAVGEQALAWGQIGLWTAYLLAYVVVALALGAADLPPQGVLIVLKRFVAIVAVAACAAGVVAYQATRPARAPANPRVFVPSPGFFLDFSPSFRTSIADAYYLNMVQYYGEHVKGDGRLDSLPAMVWLVTGLSPHFTRAYLFGAFALIDARRPDVSYEILQNGLRENPGDWRFPSYLGFFAYTFGEQQGQGAHRRATGTRRPPPSREAPPYLKRLAAALLAKGGETEKAIVMWGQVYADGDKYSRQKAVDRRWTRSSPTSKTGAHEGAGAAGRHHAEGRVRPADRRAVQRVPSDGPA